MFKQPCHNRQTKHRIFDLPMQEILLAIFAIIFPGNTHTTKVKEKDTRYLKHAVNMSL